MAVYLFTFHAYCSWLPDHPKGYVQRKKGILPPDPAMAMRYRRRAKHERVRFDAEDCRALLDAAAQTCTAPSRGWRLHLAVAVFNHVHLLISWPRFVDANRAKAVLHRALTVAMRDRRNDAATRGADAAAARSRICGNRVSYNATHTGGISR